MTVNWNSLLKYDQMKTKRIEILMKAKLKNYFEYRNYKKKFF